MSDFLKVQDIHIADTVFVFALESEAAGEFDTCKKLICGIGKVNAAYELSKYITNQRPKLIVNLCSAGRTFFNRGDVVCCKKFIQRDMDVRGLGYELYETPLSNEPVLQEYGLTIEGLPTGTCGTGDNFEMNHLSNSYNVVDMEAFALAHVARKENIPFLCLKYISDGANSGAADDWTALVHKAAKALRNTLFPVKNAENA
ncbi:MAG: hypothetical protein ACK5NK_06290 [Niabella sp.]